MFNIFKKRKTVSALTPVFNEGHKNRELFVGNYAFVYRSDVLDYDSDLAKPTVQIIKILAFTYSGKICYRLVALNSISNGFFEIDYIVEPQKIYALPKNFIWLDWPEEWLNEILQWKKFYTIEELNKHIVGDVNNVN